MNAKKIRSINNPILEIYLSQKDSIYNRFNNKELSSELADYIDKQVSRFSFKKPITIRVYCLQELSKEEQDDIVTLIRHHYGLIISEKQLIKRERRPIKLLSLAIGITLLALSALFPVRTGILTKELLSIASWIMIWETIETIIFDDTENKILELRSKQIITGKIEFIEAKKE